MPATTLSLIDISALVIVLAGTLVATIARCGFGDLGAAMRALAGLGQKGFDEVANRAALAKGAPEIRQRGHLSADPAPPPDASLAKLVDTYQLTGSIDAVHTLARADRATREVARVRAVRVFDYAGELAPVFGLVGTLFAITQLSAAGLDNAADVMMAAVANAVLSSLYGVLTAHLLCVPLAGAIERRGQREEEARARLIEWFDDQVSGNQVRGASPRSAMTMRSAAARSAA